MTVDDVPLAALQQRLATDAPLTAADRVLLQQIITHARTAAPASLTPAELAAAVEGYVHFQNTLERAGLHLERETARVVNRPWDWYFRWSDQPVRCGPFGRLDAAVIAAIGQLRSLAGVLA